MVNYSETSQVVTLFTRDSGKVAAMAKGSRRAKSSFDGPIEVFSFGEVMFIIKESGGQLATLTEFDQQPRFRLLSQNLNALNAALFAAELTEKSQRPQRRPVCGGTDRKISRRPRPAPGPV
jgi:DNA repair protein RecO (recombination protein O)